MTDETEEKLRRTIEDLQRKVASLAAQVSKLAGPYPRLFLAKDGDDEGHWQEQTVYDGEIVEWTQGRRSDEDDHPSNLIVPDGGTYTVYEYTDVDTSTGKFVTRFVQLNGAGLIPVNVLADGGDGDATPFTYTVTLKNGTQILTLAAPEWTYEPNVKVTEADRGTAYRNGDGDWVLYQVDEVPDDSDCP